MPAPKQPQRPAKQPAAPSTGKRVQMVLGSLLGLILLAGITYAAIQIVEGNQGAPDGPVEPVGNLREQAAAAGCEVRLGLPNEGATHEDRTDWKASDYKTNPPTSGNHFPTWYQDGIYAPGKVPNLGELVHTLEHGRINVQYKKGTPSDVVDQLTDFFQETEGYHLLVYENTTNMPYQVAASAWENYVGCKTFNDKTLNVFRLFRRDYIDRGPEVVP